METVKILLCDDHYFFMEGLKTVLHSRPEAFTIVGEEKCGEDVCTRVRELAPDVLLLDIQLPGINGIETVKKIRSFNQDIKIIMLTTFNETELVAGSLQAGADGYLLKHASVDQLVTAIESALGGGVQLSSDAARKITISPVMENSPPRPSVEEELLFLSPREREVFQLLVQGLNNSDIAEQLFISEKTVRNHISCIYKNLDVKNRTQAMLWAISRGLV